MKPKQADEEFDKKIMEWRRLPQRKGPSLIWIILIIIGFLYIFIKFLLPMVIISGEAF